MGYAWDITIPADTEDTEPVKRTLELQSGIITRIGCKFPAGCHGMVKIRITRGGVQNVFPLATDGYITGDDEEAFQTYYFPFEDLKHELYFEGWSPGTTYSHTVTVRITVLPRYVASFLPMMELLTKLLQRMGVV
jgi:hypothetical protein